jgi:hypothetical protein
VIKAPTDKWSRGGPKFLRHSRKHIDAQTFHGCAAIRNTSMVLRVYRATPRTAESQMDRRVLQTHPSGDRIGREVTDRAEPGLRPVRPNRTKRHWDDHRLGRRRINRTVATKENRTPCDAAKHLQPTSLREIPILLLPTPFKNSFDNPFCFPFPIALDYGQNVHY